MQQDLDMNFLQLTEFSLYFNHSGLSSSNWARLFSLVESEGEVNNTIVTKIDISQLTSCQYIYSLLLSLKASNTKIVTTIDNI